MVEAMLIPLIFLSDGYSSASMPLDDGADCGGRMAATSLTSPSMETFVPSH